MKKIIVTIYLILVMYSCRDTYHHNLSEYSYKTPRQHEVLKIMRNKSMNDFENVDFYWLPSASRKEYLSELSKMKKDYYYELSDPNIVLTIPGPGWEIRGPLTIEQVEQELLERTRKLPDIQQKPSEITLDDWHEWNNFKSQYKKGDEFYFFSSDRISWGYLRGTEGYILIRKNEVIDELETAMS